MLMKPVIVKIVEVVTVGVDIPPHCQPHQIVEFQSQ